MRCLMLLPGRSVCRKWPTQALPIVHLTARPCDARREMRSAVPGERWLDPDEDDAA